MKDPDRGSDRGVSEGTVSHVERSAPATPDFRIVKFERCSYGSKRALATIEISGVGLIDLEYFAPDQGRMTFVAGASVRDSYTGRFRRTFAIDPDLADELLSSIEQRLIADSAE